jgi:hypothetical protein
MTASQNTQLWRGGPLGRSRVTSDTLQRAPTSRVERLDLTGNVGKRKVAELINQRIELGTRTKVRVLIARVPWPVEIGLPLPPAPSNPLLSSLPMIVM